MYNSIITWYYDNNILIHFLAGRQTTNEELEEMLEQGNPAVFTQGVSELSFHICKTIFIIYYFIIYDTSMHIIVAHLIIFFCDLTVAFINVQRYLTYECYRL